MKIQTLCDIFYGTVDTLKKPEHLKVKRDGAWRGISSRSSGGRWKSCPWASEPWASRKATGSPSSRRTGRSGPSPIWQHSRQRAVDVPIYATLTPSQVLYILKDSQAKVCFVSNTTQAKKVAEVKSQAPILQHVIRMEDGPGFPEGSLSLDEVRARGREALAKEPDAVRKRAAEVKPEDLATLIYTSGTTGDPKGVMPAPQQPGLQYPLRPQGV